MTIREIDGYARAIVSRTGSFAAALGYAINAASQAGIDKQDLDGILQAIERMYRHE